MRNCLIILLLICFIASANSSYASKGVAKQEKNSSVNIINQQKIGHVDISKVLSNCREGLIATKQFKTHKNKLQNTINSKSEILTQKELKEMKEDAAFEVKMIEKRLIGKILKNIEKSINMYGQTNNFSLILESNSQYLKEQSLYNDGSFNVESIENYEDVTNDIIKKMDNAVM